MSANEDLVIAAQEGRIDDVQTLLGEGANIEYQDDQGINALIAATQEGHVSIVELLIKKKADINRPNADNQTPILLAVSLRHPITLIKLLLDAGVNVNPEKSQMDETPLKSAIHGAIKHKRMNVLKALLDAGSDLNYENPLLYAIEFDEGSINETNRIEVVRVLLDKGAKVKKAFIARAKTLGRKEIVDMLESKRSGKSSNSSSGKSSNSSSGKSSNSSSGKKTRKNRKKK
jgi:ankyrin repeat protein